MTLEDIYDQLAYGELKNVVFGRRLDEDQGIEGDHMKQILPHVQLGLTDLHKRFLLREETTYVDLQDGQSDYWLTLDFAAQNSKSKEAVKYIADTADNLFTGNLHKVEQLWGTYCSEDYRVPLNRIDRKDGVRTPQYNKIIVPTDTTDAPWLLETTQLKVIYRADHPPIREAYANAAPSQVEISLPPTHLWALCLFIASRTHNPVGISGNTDFHEGNNYAAKYEVEIARLKGHGFQIDTDVDGSEKFDRRGFV